MCLHAAVLAPAGAAATPPTTPNMSLVAIAPANASMHHSVASGLSCDWFAGHTFVSSFSSMVLFTMWLLLHCVFVSNPDGTLLISGLMSCVSSGPSCINSLFQPVVSSTPNGQSPSKADRSQFAGPARFSSPLHITPPCGSVTIR